jgi:hypothetical protein
MAGSASGDRWLDAARAIMTTDTYPKVATRTATIDGVTVTLNGMAKGAGMIAPDMATMLSFIVTDADIEPAGTPGDAQPPCRLDLQCGNGGQRYIDLRHLAGVCHRCASSRACAGGYSCG